MESEYLMGRIMASLLGFVLLYRLTANKKATTSRGVARYEKLESSENGIDQAEKDKKPDVIIVGAGVAGSALAYTLGKVTLSVYYFLCACFLIYQKYVIYVLLSFSPMQDGRNVHVIERDLTEPDRIVGELLQPGGYLKLIELGLQDCVEDIDAQQVFGYALYKGGRSTKLSYPLQSFDSNVSGRSFHNGRFIQRMREKAASLTNVRLEQGTVTSLLEANGTIKGVQYKTKTGQELAASAPLTIVCDGCFSNLRRSLCNAKVEIPSCFVALILENCELPYQNHGHVILADPSPILFYRISSSEIRCLVDIPVSQKLPSISNGEMANYLKSIVAPQPVASTINTLAGALYKVFSASHDPAQDEMRRACFDYLSLGGVFSSGPIALLSGLNPQPLSLVMHFFAVAVYGVGRLVFTLPSAKRIWMGARMISVASRIIFPIIRVEGAQHMFFPKVMAKYCRPLAL
ncbi:squalene epoxidase 3 isoform X2 [Manihot esculenta]|uniref:squalene epoxidase 3 isoform X2 n=1 Tax=Manihot esculenta TaxID=3983 RepID=UPI001CC6F1BE|nr:squalene epoxidase 3 isoform X2 [Manihot esculenta]